MDEKEFRNGAPDIADTLKERGARYGDFSTHAQIVQCIKNVMHTKDGWFDLTADKKHALDVIADKIARILNGDPEYRDNWHDIAGYATLAEQRCAPLHPDPIILCSICSKVVCTSDVYGTTTDSEAICGWCKNTE